MNTFKPHSEKQSRAIFSDKKIVILCTGLQFGKTLAGVIWLKTMMHKYTDENDNFLVCSPTYKILSQSTLPPFMQVNKDVGKLDKQTFCFNIHNGGKVWFRTGTDPDSVVGITNVRAILCDEAGLYGRYFWLNILGRSAFAAAPIRVVTTPYTLNWLWTDYIRPHQKGDPYVREKIELIQATSKENPYFPDEEYDDRRRTMDPRKFNQMYGGIFTKAEGLVYDCFDEEIHVVEPFKLPPDTRYFAGIDFGWTDPFVINVRAVTPDGAHWGIGEYYKTQCTMEEMIDTLRRFRSLWPIEAFYCDPSRPDFISAFCGAGLCALGANNEIRTGIDRHYELIKSGRYKIFKGTMPHLLDEYEMYHYPTKDDLKVDQDSKDWLPVDKDNHCIAEGTMIVTSKGEMPIENVKIGDKVLTRKGFQKVSYAECTGYRSDIFEVKTADNNQLFCTSDHFIFCNGGFIPVATIRYGDELTILRRIKWKEKLSFGTTKPIIVILTRKTRLLVSILKKRTNFYIERFGNFIREKFQKGFIYIISMAIKPITLLKTSNYYPQKSIEKNIRRMYNGAKKIKSICSESTILQNRGTHPQRVRNFIPKMVKKLAQIINQKQKSAYSVLRNFKPKDGIIQTNFVITTASRLGEESKAMITKKGFALYAWMFLPLINILKYKRVRVSVQGILPVKPEKPVKVYDLKVDNIPEFFANNILVHNCMDASRYISIATFNVGKKKNKVIMENTKSDVKTAYEPIDRKRDKLLKPKKSWQNKELYL